MRAHVNSFKIAMFLNGCSFDVISFNQITSTFVLDCFKVAYSVLANSSKLYYRIDFKSKINHF